MELLEQIIELINKGGAISWVITGLYFLVFAVAVERAVYFFLTRGKYKTIEQSLLAALSEKKPDSFFSKAAVQKYAKSQSVRMARVFIDNRHLEPKAFGEATDREGFVQVDEMERHIWMLSQIGHIAPLLGLLGTIVGLIDAFRVIAELGGDADVAAFSSGIWEAMITTANGLIVAIPAFVLYRVLEKIVERRTKEMTCVVSLLNEYHSSGHSESYTASLTNGVEDGPYETV